MQRYGYSKERRSAFWQFVKNNGIPFVCLGKRKRMFDEVAIEHRETRRSVGGAA